MNFVPFCPLFNFVVDGFAKYAGVDVKSLVGNVDDKAQRKASPRHSRNLFREPTLLPPSIGITENCRKLTPTPGRGADAKDGVDRPHASDGFIYHGLDLKSAYHMNYRTPKSDDETDKGAAGGMSDNVDEDENNHFDGHKYMTTNHDKSQESVDFIFFSERPTFELVETTPIPLAGSLAPIPNETYGSDHYSIAATFALHADQKYYEF